MTLSRLLLSVSAAASAVVCLSAYSVASSEPSFSFNVPSPCTNKAAAQSKVEVLEPLGPLYDISEPDILEAFKSRVGAMKASGEYDRRFNQNKDRIAKELEQPTSVAGLNRADDLRTWELSASVPESLPEAMLRQLSPSQCRTCPVRSYLLTGQTKNLWKLPANFLNHIRICGLCLSAVLPLKSQRSSISAYFLIKGAGWFASSVLKPFPHCSLTDPTARQAPSLLLTACPNSSL